jgi:DNA-directed RNA polymerase subunit H (RpoH/RPB5)
MDSSSLNVDLDLKVRINLAKGCLQTIATKHAAHPRHKILDHDSSKKVFHGSELAPSNDGKVKRRKAPTKLNCGKKTKRAVYI